MKKTLLLITIAAATFTFGCAKKSATAEHNSTENVAAAPVQADSVKSVVRSIPTNV